MSWFLSEQDRPVAAWTAVTHDHTLRFVTSSGRHAQWTSAFYTHAPFLPKTTRHWGCHWYFMHSLWSTGAEMDIQRLGSRCWKVTPQLLSLPPLQLLQWVTWRQHLDSKFETSHRCSYSKFSTKSGIRKDRVRAGKEKMMEWARGSEWVVTVYLEEGEDPGADPRALFRVCVYVCVACGW